MTDKKEELITAHTPDDTRYHTGISPYGTVIPRSTVDGGSRGFDPSEPILVIVDPDMEDGNLEVDLSKLSKIDDLNNKVQRVAGDSPTPDAAFQAFSAIAGELADEEKKASSPTPSPVVSKKEPSGMNKPKLRKPAASTSPAETASTPPSAVPQSGAGIESVLAEQSALLSQLTLQMADMQKEKEFVEQPSPVAEEEESNEPDLPPGHLEMPFLGLSAPLKPQKEIYFELPQAGTMGARYHEVIESGNCIALVYDTRYEDGYQWIPPSLGDAKIQMTMPREKKTYMCSSLGIHFHIGILDVVVLFKHDDEVTKENY